MWRYGEDARGTFVCSSTPTAVCPRVGGAQKANPSARKCPPGGDISPARILSATQCGWEKGVWQKPEKEAVAVSTQVPLIPAARLQLHHFM